MTRTEIIQGLIDTYGLKSYIEIGTQKRANNFDKINCEFKSCVDPDPNSDAYHKMTSDDFFNRFEATVRFQFMKEESNKVDLFFIDGLHHEEQVTRDITNALKFLSPNGFIVVHDCNPISEEMQRVPRETKVWTGNVWRSIVRLRENPSISIDVVDTDWGCGIIFKSSNFFELNLSETLGRTEDLTYANLEINREKWLNLISVEEFKKTYLQ